MHSLEFKGKWDALGGWEAANLNRQNEILVEIIVSMSIEAIVDEKMNLEKDLRK